MVWLSAQVTYEVASEVFERIGRRHIPSVSIWRQTQKHGQRLEERQQQKAAAVSVERVALPIQRKPQQERKGISMDGGMVHIRGEGWKEFKVGTIFAVEQRWERDPITHVFPNDPDRSQRWYTQRQKDLFLGAAAAIALELECADLPDLARYFRVHQRRMQYQEFRDDGYPIGSGTIESAIKQLKARLAGAGMRWSRSGARQMLMLRASVLDHSFDARWAA